MNSFMTVEWDRRCGIDPLSVLTFLEEVQRRIRDKYYGTSISKLVVVMTCMERHFKQRKRFRKASGRFEYDILLDFYLIKNVELEEKKKLIRYQMIKITEDTFRNYKFADLDKSAFLKDFKSFVNTSTW